MLSHSYIEDDNGNLVAVPRKKKHIKTTLTRPHRILIRIVDSLGLDWVDEKQFGRYNCDIFLPKYNVSIECDGVYWHSLPGVHEKDNRRDVLLNKKYGIETLRFTDIEINENKRLVKAKIVSFLKEKRG